MHGSLYSDAAIFEAKLQNIWYRTWVYVGRTLLTLLFLPALYVAWFRIHPDRADESLTHELDAFAHEKPIEQTAAHDEPALVFETQT